MTRKDYILLADVFSTRAAYLRENQSNPDWTVVAELLAAAPVLIERARAEEAAKALETETRNREAKRVALIRNAAEDLYEALKGLFEHCAMIQKHWGEGSNAKQADDAQTFAIRTIAKAEGRQ